MTKTARLAALVGAAMSLAVPAAAAAETLTVDPAVGGAACSGTRCPTIQSAVDAASAGDRIEVLKGTYAESPVVGKDVTIAGAGPGEVKVTGGGPGNVFELTAAGISLSGLSIDVPASATGAIAASADGIDIAGIVAQRMQGSGGEPVVALGGGTSISGSFVVQGAGSGAPAIASTGPGGLRLTDTVALSSTGPGVSLSESAANRVVRSTVASSAAGADGLRFAAASSSTTKQLVMDSSFLIAGPQGAALAVVTTGGAAGDVTVEGRHVTAFGAKGAVLDASAARGSALDGPSGSIHATFSSSIVHGASTTKRFVASLPLLQESNDVTLRFSASDAPPAAGDGDIDMGGASSTEDARLFAPGSLRLRVDAPVIDKGGAPAAGESDRDIEGDPRVAGAASDIGADEYVNKAPVAKFGIANPSAKVGEEVGFISGSTDPEQDAGGGIAEYRWDFGDGTRRTTDVLGVVHRYEKPGTYQVTLQVVDRQGASSPVTAPQAVTIAEVGVGPELVIAVPGQDQRVKLTRKRGRRPLPLAVVGSWADPQGIKSVDVSLRLVKRDKVRKSRRDRRSVRSSQSARCRFYTGRRLARRECDKPIWLPAAIKGTGFSFRTRRGVRLPAGRYELRVSGLDAAGNASAAPSAAARSLVAFRIR